ncbi:hypothetical protein ACOSQ3_011716 [Xanthoceras sorbifolium]
MGCVASRIDKEERVRICRERKRLMKQLLGLRGEFADAQLAYLRALKNTGVTLRQFTESESLEFENTSYSLLLPPSPPPLLPPSPPPPPPLYSPDRRKVEGYQKDETAREESIEIYENGNGIPSPPPIQSSSWENWDHLFSPPPHEHLRKSEEIEQIEEENWAETKTEFEEDDQEDEVVSNPLPEKLQAVEVVDDDSSMMSCYTKDTEDMTMIACSKKTLDGIIKDLDDYFLKTSACGKEIAILMDINKGDTYLPHNFKENKRKRSNSAKVFSALSWSWSFKSLQSSQEAIGLCRSSEPCKPGSHCITLEKLYAAEQKLYKEFKEEELAKLEYERKSMLLQKQEDENNNWIKTQKTRSCVESLESDIRSLQYSISETCSSILELINGELYPQLVALISGIMHMWRTMYECHQVQNHISQRLNHLFDIQNMDFTTDYHHQATAQLETEVNYWYNSFCVLTISQRDYVKTLCRWIQRTDCLVDDHQQSHYSSVIRKLCENWQLVFDKLPEKVASEAIKSFLSAIQAIFQQQIEELNLQKKSDRLERRLQKELNSLAEMEEKLEGSFAVEVAQSNLSPKHPVSLKRSKIAALKERVEAEKAKYLNSVEVTKAMSLSNLKTSLPNVFQVLMEFSRVSVHAFQGVHSHIRQATVPDELENSTN